MSYFDSAICNMKREQMSISAITSTQKPRYSYEQEPQLLHSYYYSDNNSQHSTKFQHSISMPLTRFSKNNQFMDSPPSSPRSFDYNQELSSRNHYYRDEENQNVKSTYNISLQERRQRNKAASAKYRLKKNIQQHEMRNMINQLSERNAILERQIHDVQQENQKLRTSADKLRGKYVAKTLLRQWMGCQKRNGVKLPMPAHSDDKGSRLLPPPSDICTTELLSDEDIDNGFESLYSADI